MKIAMAQINPVIADVAGNTQKIIQYIETARSQGAELVIFPELAVIGYPPMDLLEHKKLITDNLDALERIAAVSQDIGVIVGYADYNSEKPPMLFNAAAFIENGRIVSRHYKTLLPTYDVFDELRYFLPAETQTAAVFRGKKIGITICEDIWNDSTAGENEPAWSRRYTSDPVSSLCAQGVDLIVNISASPYVKGKNSFKWNMVSAIAKKHHVPVAYVNQVGGNDSLVFDGQSFFVSADGTFTVLGKSFCEDMCFADTDTTGGTVVPQENEERDVTDALVCGLRDYVRKCGFKSVVLGLSGGIDSALTAALAVLALGKENVRGVAMPSQYSSAGSVDDARALAENLQIQFDIVPIKDVFAEYKKDLAGVFAGKKSDVTEENLQARIRGNILMALSNKFGSMLLTTGNKSELSMGYCTLYGDMSGGLAVISDLPKMLVYRISKYINRDQKIIPLPSIEKPPSAELRENQKDEDTLPPYPVLDEILECYIEKHETADEIIARGFNEDTVRWVLKTVDRNEYKRRQSAPGLKVTSKAFGIGRRIPMAQLFKA